MGQIMKGFESQAEVFTNLVLTDQNGAILGVVSFALGLGVTKAYGLVIISLRVANLLDGLKAQERGGRHLARSEFQQFL